MARIRTIKPEFWTSEQIVECSPNARLLFIGLWNFCDDAGRHPASIRRLKMEVFPGDDFKLAQLEDWMNELRQNGLVSLYEVANKEYWQVTGWHHQKIDRPTVRYPSPGDGRLVGDNSSNGRRADNDRSPPEGKGREGSLRESKEVREGKAREPKGNTSVEQKLDGVAAVVAHYQSFHPRSKPGEKEKVKIRSRLKDGYTVDDLKAAIDGCHASPFHCGENEKGKLYQSLELIVRDSSHVNDFIELATRSGDPVLSERTRRNLRAGASFLRRFEDADETD